MCFSQESLNTTLSLLLEIELMKTFFLSNFYYAVAVPTLKSISLKLENDYLDAMTE